MKSKFALGLNAGKNMDYMKKNTSNKSCSELIFPQKTQQTHISICPRKGTIGLQKLSFLKHYNVQKSERRFVLGLNADKNTNNLKKGSNKNCSEFNFLKKNHFVRMSISPRSGAKGLKFVFKQNFDEITG